MQPQHLKPFININYSSSFCMTIQFCNNNTSYIYAIFKCLCLIKTCLTYWTIHNKYNILWIYSWRNLLHFIKKFLFLFMSSWSIYNNNFKVFFLEMINTIKSYTHRISFSIRTIKWNSYFCCILFYYNIIIYFTYFNWSNAPALKVSAHTKATFHPNF